MVVTTSEHFYQTWLPVAVYVVGSTITGMGTDYSDIDLNLLVSDSEDMSEEKMVSMLEQLGERWFGHALIQNLSIHEVPSPMLRFTVDDIRGEIVIRRANGEESVRNTHLLKCYCDLDSRVRPLAVILKRWASYNMLLGTMARRLSGFGVMLLLIFFLQQSFDGHPPVLPCLQEEFSHYFSDSVRKFKHLDYNFSKVCMYSIHYLPIYPV